MQVKFNGGPVTLTGTQLNVGDPMPDFLVKANDLSDVMLDNTSGVRVFVTVPSLDTPVCDLEVRTFNKRVQELSGVEVWTVSMDLPFAQARWCGAAGVDVVKTVSDYKDRSFGQVTGTMISELGLLTRAVFVVGATGEVAYVEYVPEVTEQPNFDAAFAKIKELL